MHRVMGPEKGSALDDLIKDVKFVVELGVGFAILGNLANRVQYRGVVTAAKRLTYFRQGEGG